jgi:hypothetical protein
MECKHLLPSVGLWTRIRLVRAPMTALVVGAGRLGKRWIIPGEVEEHTLAPEDGTWLTLVKATIPNGVTYCINKVNNC